MKSTCWSRCTRAVEPLLSWSSQELGYIYIQHSSAVFFFHRPHHKKLLPIIHSHPIQIPLVDPFKFVMFHSSVAILSVFLAYYTVSSAAAAADCLRQTGLPTNSSTSPTYTHVTVDCPKPDNQTCESIQTTRYVQAKRTLNITTKYTADVFDTFSKSFNVVFKDVNSTFTSITNKPLNDSTPVQTDSGDHDVPQRCYTGVIQKDCFNDIPTGTAVEACRPYILDETTNGPSDLGNETITTEEPTPSTTNPAPSATPNGSVAIHLLGHGGWRSSLLMVTMVMTMMKIGNYFVAF